MDSNTERAAAEGPRRRRRFIIASVCVAATMPLLLALIVLTGAERLAPDDVARSCGTYLSPRGKLLVVKDADNGMIQIQFESRRWWQRVLNRVNQRVRPQPDWEFERERDWFFCFDKYDRLWVFIGRRDPAIAHRQTSSGGFVPRIQSVLMSGFWFVGSRPIGGACVVTDTGDWQGVPPRFFEQIPCKADPSVDVWGEIPPIPATPPEFTPGERAAAAVFLK